ncbi:MAG: dephospho-CoA kinase [Anaerolineae bacterium]|nr:dephospho-CoA kinase [Anaerolineae bacterium]
MSRWPNKYVIGLTGNIAVGKSVVRQMLQHLGAYTIDADGLSHQAMQPGAPAYIPVVDTFGQFILGPDKRINRALLGQIVFSNPEALRKLEAIVHPIVRQAVNTLVTRSKQRVVVIEAIKLLEGGLAEGTDSIWVVDASPETQLQRLMQKRKAPEAEARQRITAQNPQADKLARANVVIHNDGNVEETWKQVQDAWNLVRQAVIQQHAPGAGAQAAPAKPVTRAAEETQPSMDATVARPSAPIDVHDLKVEVKRGMPGNAEAIAQFITTVTDSPISRMDIMLAFGQKSYLLAQDQHGNQIGVIGWQVENLITRTDEFYLRPNIPPGPVINALIIAIEEASMDLQSEVSFIFLADRTSDAVIQPFLQQGYHLTTVREIKIPAWREAVQEVVNASNESSFRILTKKLREDRVLQPL